MVTISHDNFPDMLVELMVGAREAAWTDSKGRTMLHYASMITRGDEGVSDDVVANLINADPIPLMLIDNSGYTPFLSAVATMTTSSTFDTAKLLAPLSNTQQCDILGNTCLHILAKDNKITSDEFRYFLQFFDDYNISNTNGETPLMLLAMNAKDGKFDYEMQMLIDRGADPNWVDKEGNSILIKAAMCLGKTSDGGVIKFLIERGADASAKSSDGRVYTDFFPKPKNYSRARDLDYCMICCCEIATILCTPCGHGICCQSCLDGPSHSYSKCPVCTKPATGIFDITHIIAAKKLEEELPDPSEITFNI